MGKIVKINNVPKNVIKTKKGTKTRRIYYEGSSNDTLSLYFGLYDESIVGKNQNEKFTLSLGTESSGMTPIFLNLYKDNVKINSKELGSCDGILSSTVKGDFLIETDSPITIESKESYFYYEVPPPLPDKVDKLPSNSSLTETYKHIDKITKSIKSCKSYIAYVINNKGGSATDTETLESLINKLKDIKF